MHNFSSLLNITLHVSDGLSVHHQEFKTVRTASSICHTGSADFLLAGTRWNCSSISFPLASSQQNLYDIYLMLYVQSWTPDEGRKDRPKHVDWYSINSKNCASSWFYHRNISRCKVPWTSKNTLSLFRSFYLCRNKQFVLRLVQISSMKFVTDTKGKI